MDGYVMMVTWTRIDGVGDGAHEWIGCKTCRTCNACEK